MRRPLAQQALELRERDARGEPAEPARAPRVEAGTDHPRGHPRFLPLPPGDAERRASRRPPGPGDRVQFRVGSGVRALTDRSQEQPGTRIQHEEIERQIPREGIEHPRSTHLPLQHRAPASPRLVHEHPVIHHACRVHHAAERRHRLEDLVAYRGHGALVGGVGGTESDIGTLRDALVDDALDLGRRLAAAGQHDVPRTRFDEPACRSNPQRAGAAGDPVTRLGACNACAPGIGSRHLR